MSLSTLLNRLKNIMRGDAGVGGDEQRLSQMIWILFLKIFDYKEEEWECTRNDYQPIIPIGYRWRDWAVPKNPDGTRDLKNQLTGEELIEFVNSKLFRVLSGEPITIDGKRVVLLKATDSASLLVKEFMKESNNFMKNGVLLRQVVDVFDSIDFDNMSERHAFNDIYESMLRGLQKHNGDIFTPRALTTIAVLKTDPKKNEKVADFAAGTGGFLIDALNHMESQNPTIEEIQTIHKNLYGVEKKQLPFMLCTTNLLLHNVDNPNIIHGNTLETNVREYTEDDKFDVILMNPPYGGSELELVQKNFPAELRNAETADLFMIEIMYRLKDNGRCGVILPEGFMFGTDSSKAAIKKKLVEEFNLHTIIRLPGSCFAPYTSINTNLLFFDKTGATKETWFYRFDLPGERKFSMTKNPITVEKLQAILDWWDNRVEIKDEKEDESLTETWKSKKINIAEIVESGYSLDFCGFPKEESVILSPEDTINNFKEKQQMLDEKLEKQLAVIISILGEKI